MYKSSVTPIVFLSYSLNNSNMKNKLERKDKYVHSDADFFQTEMAPRKSIQEDFL